jgi:alkyl hydroperoxide reductase subunit AhpC
LTKQEKERVQILAVSIDSHDDSKKLVKKLMERSPGDYDFAFLEDKNHKVIDRYGILNPDGSRALEIYRGGLPQAAIQRADTG